MARRTDTRERILEAARHVIRVNGLVRATTKEIARAAAVSEGTLYNHFTNKEELFLCTLRQLPSGFIGVIMGLPGRAGSETVRAVLGEVARAAVDFYAEAVPMGASIFADPQLLARQREFLASHGAGPQRANEAVAAYLRAEQGLGRVRADVDPEAAAYMLLGPIFQRSYWHMYVDDREQPGESERFIASILDTLEQLLLPAVERS